MNLYHERSANLRKTWFLMTGFFILVIAVGFLLSEYFGNSYILYGAVAFSLLMNVYSYWFSHKLVLSMTHAKPATRAEFFDFYTITENLCIAAGLPLPKLYVIDDPAPNAFATGRNEKHAVVCATTGLLSMMDRTELEGVIAHELSHIQNRDMLVMTVAVVLAGFLAILADIFLRVSMFGGGDNNKNVHPAIAIIAVVGIVLAPFAAKLIQLAISRRREYLADTSGALMTRYPEGLASALEKIGSYRTPMRHTSHATAHLFISNPFGSMTGKLNRLFTTHPPVEERVRRLRSAA